MPLSPTTTRHSYRVWNVETRTCERTWECPVSGDDVLLKVHVLHHDRTKAAAVTTKGFVHLINIDTMETIKTLGGLSLRKRGGGLVVAAVALNNEARCNTSVLA